MGAYFSRYISQRLQTVDVVGTRPGCCDPSVLCRMLPRQRAPLPRLSLHTRGNLMAVRQEQPPDVLGLTQGLFNEDTILPVQFELSRKYTCEQRLLYAVMQDALKVFFRYQQSTTFRGRSIFKEIVTWFTDTRSYRYGSCQHVCDHLGFDYEQLRRGILRLVPEELPTPKKCVRGDGSQYAVSGARNRYERQGKRVSGLQGGRL